mgnify:FL=1
MDSTPPTTGAESSSVPPTPADEPKTGTDADSRRPDPDEGLPELEPLTPELVEDEAIRGDFMLRWAAVLLAMLLGWTEITETLTLVRIKTGEYLLSNGWLPPATDVFSATAGERAWYNFAWLGDLLLAGVHAAGGDAALTMLAALLAGVSIWCVTESARKGVSNWWGSICAVLALLAAFPLLRPGPDSITILGLALTMLILMKAEERPERARYVLLVPLLWLWSNLDAHAFLGAAVVAAYGIGDLIDSRRTAVKSSGKAWMFAAAGVLVMLLHPFHIHVAKAPLLMYGVEASEQLKYAADGDEFGFLWGRVIDREFWQELNVFTLAGVLTAFAALLSIGLNRKHLRASHVLVWAAVFGLALASAQALAAGSIAMAVLAGVNGQEWYRRGFRQSYSTDAAELIFSRGGRALTVLGMFAIGYFAASGRLMGADGRRLGMGFRPEIESSLASFQDVLAESHGDSAFNFNVNQGDMLIWVGHKPFIDSRLGLYAGQVPNIAEEHRDLRLAMLQRKADDDRFGRRDVWHAAFSKYGISQALPRLSGVSPNYETLYNLLTDPEREWRLVKLGAATAALYWNRLDDSELAAFLAEHPGADFLRQAFPREPEGDDPDPLPPLAPPQPESWYDRMLILPRHHITNDVQLARHYVHLRTVLANRISQDYATALLTLAIRHARRGLQENPDSVEAYHVLSASYLGLSDTERYLDPQGRGVIGPLRFRQAMASLFYALRCNPDDAPTHMTLYQLLQGSGKPDLALPHLREVERITGSLTILPPEEELAQQDADQNRELLKQLTGQIEKVRKELRDSLNSDTDRLEVIQAALERGLPGEALRLLEEDQTVIAQNANVQMLYAELLLDAGRMEDALMQLEPMSSVMAAQSPSIASGWRAATAVANIAAGNYERARTLLIEDAEAATLMRLQSVLGVSPQPGVMPGVSTVPLTHAPRSAYDMRSLSRVTLLADLLAVYPELWNRDQFILAMCDLEDGRNQAMIERFDKILERDPETSMRPTLAYYRSMTTGEPTTFIRPSQEIPVWGGMFADDSELGPALPRAVPADDDDDGRDAAGVGSPPAPPTSQRRDSADAP